MYGTDRLLEMYRVDEQLDALMPECFAGDMVNENEKLPDKYPVKNAPKVKGWFGLITIKYMAKVRNIRKLCVQYINTYVESALNVIKKLDKVKMIQSMSNLADDLSMSFSDRKRKEQKVNTESGLAFLGGEKALKDKLDAILAQIDVHAQKSEQLKLWADLMKLKSKEIACNIVFSETNRIIDKEKDNLTREEEERLREATEQMEEAVKGSEKAQGEAAEEQGEIKDAVDALKDLIAKMAEKHPSKIPDDMKGNNGIDAKALDEVASTTQLVKLAKALGATNAAINKCINKLPESQHGKVKGLLDAPRGKNESVRYGGGRRMNESSTHVMSFSEFKSRCLDESYIPVTGNASDVELERAIRQASKYVRGGLTRVYAEDISPDEPIILDSSAIRGRRWLVNTIDINGDDIQINVQGYNGNRRSGMSDDSSDILPLAAFTDESVNRLYDIIERYNDRRSTGKRFNESLSGTSGVTIKNSNTNFPKFDVPEADVDIVEYIRSRYREVWGCDEKWNDLYGGDWRCYSFLDRRDRYDFYMNDEYFGTIISKGKLHKRSEAGGDARRLVGTVMQDAQRNRKEDEDNWLLQM